jgi:hypothetical protein
MHILAVLAEMDLMKNFISRFEDIALLGNITPFRLLVHSKIKMPMMVANRDLILQGFGVVNEKEKTILIPCKSIAAHNYFDVDLPKENSSYKRIDLVVGFFHIKCIGENTYCLTNCYNVDPKVSVIPWFVINTVIKEINYYILEGLKKQIENGDKEIYEKRIQEKIKFYDKIREQMLSFV